jgi:hypothetical protein
MRNQQIVVTAISDTKIGCNTFTPNLVLRRPVIIGKTDPPICAKTKTMESAVDLVSDGNNRDPTDIAWKSVSMATVKYYLHDLQRQIEDRRKIQIH